jgi:two-component system, chemotaxis family, CheB/CheR fusion protein
VRRVGRNARYQSSRRNASSRLPCADLPGGGSAQLPIAGLAHELRRLPKQAKSVRSTSAATVQAPAYAQVLALLRRHAGVDFTSYKESTLLRRIQRRQLLHGLIELGAYVELLERNPSEASVLAEEMLVHVTSFFREPAVFDALRAQIFPKLCEGRSSNNPLRIWVPGCSTGEEVYSIVICLIEFLEHERRDVPLQIFGTDISAAVIDRARRATYPDSIEGEVSQERLARFFSKTNGASSYDGTCGTCVFSPGKTSRTIPPSRRCTSSVVETC